MMDYTMCDVSTGEENSTKNIEKQKSKREQWGRKLDYVLTILGCIVGFGNVWRFPYICMKNGGGAFLIPYVLILFLMVIPVYLLEASLGQFTGKAIRDVWNYCPLVKGMGIGIQVTLVPTVCYYIMLLTWVMNYMYYTFQSPLPWSTCGNSWNTPECFSVMDNLGLQLTTNVSNSLSSNITDQDQHSADNISNVTSRLVDIKQLAKTGHSASEEFWQYQILGISSGLEDVGSLNVNLVISLILAWVVIYLCIIKGIKSSGKVVYVTATLPYLLLITLLIHNLTLPGSVDGIVFFIKPDFRTLLDIQVWIQAAIQIFYSLCIGWGVHITLSRYNKFNNDCLRDTYMLTIASEGTSVFAGCVVFSAFGFMAHQANIPITEVAKSGPGLGFVAYPMALAQMPLPNLWAVLFFIAMLTLGMDTQFVLTETLLVYFEDSFPSMKKKQVLFRACLILVVIMISLPFCTQAGVYMYQLFDWYIGSLPPLFFTLIECCSVAWLYGTERFSRDVEMMIGRRVPGYIKFCWSFLSPLLLLSLMVTCLVSYVPPTYGDYVYPKWAAVTGWTAAMLPVVLVVVIGFKIVFDMPGKSIYQKLRHSIRPTEEWHPAVGEVDYLALAVEIKETFPRKILINLGLSRQTK